MNEIRQIEGRNKLNVYDHFKNFRTKLSEKEKEYLDQYFSYHDMRADESKADIDALRYQLRKDKLYDPGTQDFTPELLKKAKEKYGNFKVLDRLFKNFSDENLIYLMNNIAKNESKGATLAESGISLDPEPKQFFESYLRSPKYRERLLKQGYANPENVINERLGYLRNMQVLESYPGMSGSQFDPDTNTVYMDSDDFGWFGKGYYRNSSEAHERSHGLGARGGSDLVRQAKENIPNNTYFSYDDIYENMYRKSPRYLNPNEVRQLEGRNKLNVYSDFGRKISEADEHDMHAQETKADLDAIRYRLWEDKIYNAGTEDFSPEHLKKAKEKYKKDPIMKRLLKNFSEENIIYLMNNIAKSRNSNSNLA